MNMYLISYEIKWSTPELGPQKSIQRCYEWKYEITFDMIQEWERKFLKGLRESGDDTIHYKEVTVIAVSKLDDK